MTLDTMRQIAEGMDVWQETCFAERIQLLGNIDHLENLEKELQRVFDQDDVQRSFMDLYPWLREDFDLRQAGGELKNDKEVVLIAVARDGLALQHASVELRRDKEVVMAAVNQNELAVKYASDELKQNDEDVNRVCRDLQLQQQPLISSSSNFLTSCRRRPGGRSPSLISARAAAPVFK